MPTNKKPNPFDNIKSMTPAKPNTVSDPRANRHADNMTTQRADNVLKVSLSAIKDNPKQIRRVIDPTSIAELAQDIEANGLLQPLVVRQINDDEYELVAGQRRLLAVKNLDWAKVPVVVVDKDDKQMRLSMLAENLQRENLSDEDEREVFLAYQNEFNYSVGDIASMVHKSRSYVSRKLNEKPSGQPQPISDENHEITKMDRLNNSSQAVTAVPSPVERGRPVKPAFSVKPLYTATRAIQRWSVEDVPDEAVPGAEQAIADLKEQIAHLEKILATKKSQTS